MPDIKPIRILVVSGSLGIGGAEMQAARMLPRLDRNLFDVEVIYYNGNPGPPREELVANGVPVTHVGPQEWRRAAYLRDAYRFMRRGRYDLVHAWFASANHYGRLPAMLAGIPIRVGGLLGRRGFEGLWPAVYSLMNPFCAGWIVNSEELRQLALKKMLMTGFSPVVVVPNGIDLDQDRTRLERLIPAYAAVKRDKPVIGMVGRLHPVKNHSMLLDAAALLRDQGVDADFWIIGDGPERSAIRQQINARALDDRVHMWGQRDDVEAAYEVMDVAVLTSDSEGCPNVLLEAMRAGRPLVATRCTSLDSLVIDGSNGFAVERGNAGELAGRLRLLLADRALRDKFGAESRRLVESTFSMPVAVRRLEQAYLGFMRPAAARHPYLREKLAGLGIA